MNICPTWCRLWLLLLSIAILSDAVDAILSATTFISNNPTPLFHQRTIMSASSLKGDDDGVLEEVMEPVKFEPSSPSSKQQSLADPTEMFRIWLETNVLLEMHSTSLPSVPVLLLVRTIFLLSLPQKQRQATRGKK